VGVVEGNKKQPKEAVWDKVQFISFISTIKYLWNHQLFI